VQPRCQLRHRRRPARRRRLHRPLTPLAHAGGSSNEENFKETAGLPPIAYLHQQRAELAASLLLHTEQSVAQIAEAVGWPDPNYFARRFKSHFGLSASDYRSGFSHNAIRLASGTVMTGNQALPA
jgi:transcriptional regulator GlxA family with amidase domain